VSTYQISRFQIPEDLVCDIEEHRLRALRRIFGPKREKVTGGCRKLHNEELHNLYISPSVIIMLKSRRMRWAGFVARTEAKRNAHMVLVGKSEGKRLLGRPKHRWEDNIKMDVREIWWGGVYWLDLAQDRDQWRAVVNTVIGKFLSS
jgi:hypothetical protein